MGEERARGGSTKRIGSGRILRQCLIFCNEKRSGEEAKNKIKNQQELGMQGIGGREVWTPCYPPPLYHHPPFPL